MGRSPFDSIDRSGSWRGLSAGPRPSRRWRRATSRRRAWSPSWEMIRRRALRRLAAQRNRHERDQRVPGGQDVSLEGEGTTKTCRIGTLSRPAECIRGFRSRFVASGSDSPPTSSSATSTRLSRRRSSTKSRPRFVGVDTMNLWIAEALAGLKEVLRRVDVSLHQRRGIPPAHGREAGSERRPRDHGARPEVRGDQTRRIRRASVRAELSHFSPAVLLPRVVDPTGAGDAFAGGFMGFVAGAGRLRPAVSRPRDAGGERNGELRRRTVLGRRAARARLFQD